MPTITAKEYLIREAQLLKTGANNHDTEQLIAMYRGAIKSQHLAAITHFEKALEERIVFLRANRARTSVVAV